MEIPWLDESDNLTFLELSNDGWFELELSEYFIENEDDCILYRVESAGSEDWLYKMRPYW